MIECTAKTQFSKETMFLWVFRLVFNGFLDTWLVLIQGVKYSVNLQLFINFPL